MRLSKNIINILMLLGLASAAAVFFIYYISSRPQRTQATQPLPTVLPLTSKSDDSAALQEHSSKWISPDGKKQVLMKEQSNTDKTKIVNFYVTDATVSGQLDLPIFSKTLATDSTFTIPHNTFSNDDKYLFLEEKNSDKTHYLVFKANGKPFADDQPYIDVTEAFEKYTSTYHLRQATGWAAELLLIIQTLTDANTSGPSFWFDLSSKSFIQLSTRF